MSLRRMGKRRSSEQKQPTLNLVSLMDIFTILVFFLMVNANEVEILETSTAIKLPDSISEEAPEDRVSIEVSHDDLLLQGEVIGNVQEIMASNEPMIGVLVAELENAKQQQMSNDVDTPFNGKVTIMGDKALPYELLKRVMLSCQTASYTSIALAVNQVGEKEEAS